MITAAALLFSPAASASLIGTTVSCEVTGGPTGPFCNPPSTNPDSAVVVSGGSPEFEIGFTQFTDPSFSVDLDDATIVITQIFPNSITTLGGAAMNLELTNLVWQGTPGVITGFQLQTTGVTGFDASDITPSDNSIFMTLVSGAVWNIGSSATITLEVLHDQQPPSQDVAEPAALAFFGLGLAGLSVFRRRRIV